MKKVWARCPPLQARVSGPDPKSRRGQRSKEPAWAGEMQEVAVVPTSKRDGTWSFERSETEGLR